MGEKLEEEGPTPIPFTSLAWPSEKLGEGLEPSDLIEVHACGDDSSVLMKIF